MPDHRSNSFSARASDVFPTDATRSPQERLTAFAEMPGEARLEYPSRTPDLRERADGPQSWQDLLKELENDYPLEPGYLPLRDAHEPANSDSIVILREGKLEEIIPVHGSEQQLAGFFAPDGEAERIAQQDAPTIDRRIFVVDERFYSLPEHVIDNAEAIGQRGNVDIQEALPEPIVRHIRCRNEGLEGERHPITGVPFERKQIEVNGEIVEGVFAQFDSAYTCTLPEELYQASNAAQFEHATDQLREAVTADPELRAQFTEEQLEQIANGETPDGYTWHHAENPGELQLVDTTIHAQTGHTGGQVVWGGGAENR